MNKWYGPAVSVLCISSELLSSAGALSLCTACWGRVGAGHSAHVDSEGSGSLRWGPVSGPLSGAGMPSDTGPGFFYTSSPALFKVGGQAGGMEGGGYHQPFLWKHMADSEQASLEQLRATQHTFQQLPCLPPHHLQSVPYGKVPACSGWQNKRSFRKLCFQEWSLVSFISFHWTPSLQKFWSLFGGTTVSSSPRRSREGPSSWCQHHTGPDLAAQSSYL